MGQITPVALKLGVRNGNSKEQTHLSQTHLSHPRVRVYVSPALNKTDVFPPPACERPLTSNSTALGTLQLPSSSFLSSSLSVAYHPFLSSAPSSLVVGEKGEIVVWTQGCYLRMNYALESKHADAECDKGAATLRDAEFSA